MKLVRFLMKLVNESVTIELKNGDTVSGTVANVSPQMNTSLRQCKLISKRVGKSGDKTTDARNIDTMNIRGNTLRYIILPDALPLDTMLVDDTPKPKNRAKKEVEAVRGRGGRGGRGGGRGRGRGRGRGGRGF